MLSIALDGLIPLLQVFINTFDVTKLTKTDDGTIDLIVIKACAYVLKVPYFLEFSEMVRSCGIALERNGHRLEGCECHRALWMANISSAMLCYLKLSNAMRSMRSPYALHVLALCYAL